MLECPDTSQIAQKLGLVTIPSREFYDVVVVGAGPAGLACTLYCTTEGMRALLLEREAAGGQAALSSRIENYLGFPAGLSGADLARRGLAQVRRFGAEVLAPAEAVGLESGGRVPRGDAGGRAGTRGPQRGDRIRSPVAPSGVPAWTGSPARASITAQPQPNHNPARTKMFTYWAERTRPDRRRYTSPKSRDR
ncbi:MAG: NAD(P)/FAD-dependent oxidoreductase [Paludibaculum sp.]